MSLRLTPTARTVRDGNSEFRVLRLEETDEDGAPCLSCGSPAYGRDYCSRCWRVRRAGEPSRVTCPACGRTESEGHAIGCLVADRVGQTT